MPDYSRISILINTHNRAEMLPNVLNSVLLQNYPRNKMEILILNDASKDDTASILTLYSTNFRKAGFENCKIYANKVSKNIAWGRYFLSTKISADSKAILFMDDDVVLETTGLSKLYERLFSKKETGIVGPKIVYYKNPQKTAHCASFINRWTGCYSEVDSEQEIKCDWLNSSCMLVKTAALAKSGGFYPGFYVSHQEVDFCLKVKKAGFEVVYFPSVKIRHDIEFKRSKRERLYYIYRNKMLVIHRNFPVLNKIVALSLITAFGLPKYVLESVMLHKKAFFAEIRIIFLAVIHGLLAKEGKMNEAGD